MGGGGGGGESGVERGQGEVVDGSGFAGDTVVVHGVDAIGGDVHLEEVAVGDFMDTLDSDATEGEVFGELAVVYWKRGEEGAEPMGEDVHVGLE